MRETVNGRGVTITKVGHGQSFGYYPEHPCPVCNGPYAKHAGAHINGERYFRCAKCGTEWTVHRHIAVRSSFDIECPRCGKVYDMNDHLDEDGLPECPDCQCAVDRDGRRR